MEKNDDRIFIVSKKDCECFTLVKRHEDVDKQIERAKNFYTDELQLYKNNLREYPEMSEHWKSQIESCECKLKGGFEGIEWGEFKKRQDEKWLSKEAKEITEEQWDYALGELPPLKWHGNEHYSTFFMSEMMTLTYTSQFYYDKETGKYYTALVDFLNEETWIDKLLKKQSNH